MDSFSKRGRWSIVLSFLLMASAILSGCSGKSSDAPATTTTNNNPTGGSGAALQMAEKISVVDAKSATGGVAPLRVAKYVPPTAVTAAGTDYANDVTQTWTYERSEEAFGTINEILCSVGQTQYDAMVNKGTYKAMIDINQCSSKRDSAQSAGQESSNQSSGSTAPDYETWIVNSYRETDTSPQIIRAWIKQKASGPEPGKVIMAKVTVTESVSATNPYGIFIMNFIAYPEINGNTMTANPMFKGILKAEKDATSGKVLLKFAMKGGFGDPADPTKSMTMEEYTVLDRSADGTTGSGSISHSFIDPRGSETAKFDVAFNDNNFYRQDASSNKVCLDRKSYNESAWRYGLYDSAGKRVNRNSGFPIKYTDTATAKDYFGWAGYYGLWLPDSVTLNDGAAVKKQVFSSSGPPTETEYTLLKKGGKLKKHTQGMLTLAEIKGIPLDYGEQSGATWTNFRVEWDGIGFKKKAKQGTPPNYMWGDLAAADQTYISLTTLGWGELNFWSQSLGGQVRVKLTATTSGIPPAVVTVTYSYPAETTANTVVFYKEDIVYPGDFTSTASFSCYDNCPVYDASATGTGVTSSGWQPATTAYTYTFGSDMVLKDTTSSTNSLLMTKAGTDNQQWGFMSGPMFDPAKTDSTGKTYLDLLKCDWQEWDPVTNTAITKTCGWKAWSVLPEFYTWETGLNNWNQFTALKDAAGAVVHFDAPLQVKYTHSQTITTARDYKYNGAKFYLEYAGFGELHGIPGVCVDGDTGAPIDCAQGGSGKFVRWVPEFMIPEGSAVTNGTTATYYVKPQEVERRMKAGADCSALTLTSYTLPDVSLWEDPAIGDIPTVTNAPAVVGGVVQ